MNEQNVKLETRKEGGIHDIVEAWVKAKEEIKKIISKVAEDHGLTADELVEMYIQDIDNTIQRKGWD